MTASSVASAILELLSRHGVTRAFGVPGVHNLPFWDTDIDLPIVGVRHEQAAGYAADGLYRASGQTALALLTSGPGAANVLGAFGEAFVSGSPIMVIASEPSHALRSSAGPRGLLHEMADQGAMFAAFGAPARTARTRQEAMASTVLALRDSWGPPPTATYIGIPSDVLGEPWTAAIPHIPRLPSVQPDDHRIGELAELIAASPRCVLWLGGGVVAADAEEAVAALAHHLGAPVLTSFAGRGLMAGDPLLIDVPVHEPEVGQVLAGADLVLILGSSFDGMNTMNWRVPLPARRAAITLGSLIEQTVDLDCLISADLGPSLQLLQEALAELGVQPRPAWASTDRIRDTIVQSLLADPRTATAMQLVNAVDAAWPNDGVIVCDMAVAGYWYGGYSSQPRPRRLQYPVGWGTLGYALPAAIGPASIGLSTLAVCGDGGPMFALGELATYAQESLPVTLLVVDDGGYGMLRFDQETFGHRVRGVDLFTPDWTDLGSAFGIGVETVSDVAQIPHALRTAHTANLRGEPRIIVWSQRLFPPRSTSPRWAEPPT